MRVSENISLLNLNSFGVEARAARLIEWTSVDELREISFEGRWLALGGGNNMLFTSDFDGILIKSAARRIDLTRETTATPEPGKTPAPAETLAVRAEAGVNWGDFVDWCIARQLWGVENLSGIPGTIGAAPIQNIGAYGTEIKDVITSVECFDVATSSILTLAAEHCGFGYRDSVFKGPLRGRVIVTAVNFALSKEPRPNLRYAAVAESERRLRIVEGAEDSAPSLSTISRAVIAVRNSKLPDQRTTGNAGSFFKNPVVDTAIAHHIAARHPGMPLYPAATGTATGTAPATKTGAATPNATATAAPAKTKLSAGWLIEQSGWKGRVEGRVGIHPQQALIIVNLGGATGREIVDFARKIQYDVKTKFGVELTPEVNIIC